MIYFIYQTNDKIKGMIIYFINESHTSYLLIIYDVYIYYIDHTFIL